MRPQFTPQQYMRTLIEQAQQGVLQKKKGGKKSGKGGSRGEESIGSGTASIQLQINSEALKEREEGTVQREHLMRNLIAILRGVEPKDALDIASALLDQGISIIDPQGMNSQTPTPS